MQKIEPKKGQDKIIKAEYNQALSDLNSNDLFAKEMAMKTIRKN